MLDFMEHFIRSNLMTGIPFVEPYAGGASLTLGLLSRKVVSESWIVERDPLLFSFWKVVFTRPLELCERIHKLNVSISTWKRFQKYLVPDAVARYDEVELALAALFLNRTNFSGILHAAPIGGMSQTSEYSIDCRFYPDTIIDRILSASEFKRNVKVYYDDAVAFLRRKRRWISNGKRLVFLDPPYHIVGKRLYRYHYEKKDFDTLGALISKATYPWIVTVGNDPLMRRVFYGQPIIPIHINYTVKQSRKAQELLISNVPLPRILMKHPIFGFNTPRRAKAL